MSSFPESYGLPCFKTWETFLLGYRGGLGGQIPRDLLFPSNLGQDNIGFGEGKVENFPESYTVPS